MKYHEYQYTAMTSQATAAIATGRGVLHTITLNKPVATSTLTVYDNTAASGTKVATITVPASPMPVTLTYDTYFSKGLTVVMGTADMDVTISWAQD